MASDLIVWVAAEVEWAVLRPFLPALCTGMGAVNPAYSLTPFWEPEKAKIVVTCGIGDLASELREGSDFTK